MKLGSLSPRYSVQKAINARRGRGLPYRPERRLVDTEAARARIAAGFRRKEQRQAPGPKDSQKLSKEDRKVLTLRNRGLWPSEIAALYHLEEEAPAIEIRAHVVKRNLLQDGVAEVARPFDTCRNSHLERVIGRGAGR